MAGHAFNVNFTPPGAKPAPQSPAPVLQLKPFQRPPTVSFGTVKVGAAKCVNLVLSNHSDQTLQVSVQKVPESAGFSVPSQCVSVPVGMEVSLPVLWRPTEGGNVRGVMGLTTNSGLRLQCILLGTGKAPPPIKKPRRVRPLQSHNNNVSRQSSTVVRHKPPPPAAPAAAAPAAAADTTVTVNSCCAPPVPCPGVIPSAASAAAAVSPLNSTHCLETGSESARLMNQLRTPPDFSISIISTAPESVDIGGATPRRQTFLVNPPQLVAASAATTAAAAVAVATEATPSRRLTFVCSQENVPPATAATHQPGLDSLLQTPRELRRVKRESGAATSSSNRMAAPASLPLPPPPLFSAHGAGPVLSTPVLFPRAVCKMEPLSPIVSDDDQENGDLATATATATGKSGGDGGYSAGDCQHQWLCTPQLFGRVKSAVSAGAAAAAAADRLVPLSSSPHANSPLLDCMPMTRATVTRPLPCLIRGRGGGSDGDTGQTACHTDRAVTAASAAAAESDDDKHNERQQSPAPASCCHTTYRLISTPQLFDTAGGRSSNGSDSSSDHELVKVEPPEHHQQQLEEKGGQFGYNREPAQHQQQLPGELKGQCSVDSDAEEQLQPQEEVERQLQLEEERQLQLEERQLQLEERQLQLEEERQLQLEEERQLQLEEERQLQLEEERQLQLEEERQLQLEQLTTARLAQLCVDQTNATHCDDTAPKALMFIPLHSSPPAAGSPLGHQVSTPSTSQQRRLRRRSSHRRQQQQRTPRRLTLAVTPGRARRALPVTSRRTAAGAGITAARQRPSAVSARAPPPQPRHRLSLRPRRPVGVSGAASTAARAAGVTPAASSTVGAVQPSIFMSRGALYDRDWAEKRGRGLTAWVNMVLTPSEEFRSAVVERRVDSSRLMVDLSQSYVPPAPSAETLSLRAYTAVRRLNQLRHRAFRLYESAAVVAVLSNIDRAVEQGSLRVRKDRALHADMGLKQMVVGWLVNYHPLWLRLGLETVYGLIIHTRSTDDLQTLVHFVIDRLLWNSQLASQYSHRTVPHLYSGQFEPALKRFTLKTLLMLVYFLDLAKRRRLIRHDPCLFNKHAPVKASRDILVTISRELLSGEGCIIKHLSYLGLTVAHSQTKLDEFDYAVQNIGADLRCGIRLARLVEVLSESDSVSLRDQLRVPAVDRHQKLYNVKLAVDASCLQLQLSSAALARQLIDGHKEATLNTVWQLAVRHEIAGKSVVADLKREIASLDKSLANNCFIGNEQAIEGRRLLAQLPSVTEAMAATMDCARVQGSVSAGAASAQLCDASRAAVAASGSCLLSWCRLVCAHYAVPVADLCGAVRDGRLYCLLLHHYQPALLPLHRMHRDTRDSHQAQTVSALNNSDDDDSDNYYDEDEGDNGGAGTGAAGFRYPCHQLDSTELARLARNERSNIALALQAMSQLGGVAVLHTAADFTHFPPDWQLVLLQLQLLCRRLLQLGREQSAARQLQLWWRRLLHCRQLRKQQVAPPPPLPPAVLP